LTASPLKNSLAFLNLSGSAAFGLMRASLQDKLVYRFDLVVGLIRTFILIFIFRYLWIALYAGRQSYAGVTLDQTITYAAISLILSPLFPNSLIVEVGRRIRNGNILFDITRPIYFGNLLLFQMSGQFIATLLTTALPMLALTFLAVKLVLPGSPLVWLAFLVSLIMGFITAFLIDYIASLAGFWTTEIGGIFYAKWSVVDILGGKFLPLWIFPTALQQIALVLPFRGINYTPLAILIGEINLSQIPTELGMQLLWLLILAGLGRLIYSLAVKKLSVQGG